MATRTSTSTRLPRRAVSTSTSHADDLITAGKDAAVADPARDAALGGDDFIPSIRSVHGVYAAWHSPSPGLPWHNALGSPPCTGTRLPLSADGCIASSASPDPKTFRVVVATGTKRRDRLSGQWTFCCGQSVTTATCHLAGNGCVALEIASLRSCDPRVLGNKTPEPMHSVHSHRLAGLGSQL